MELDAASTLSIVGPQVLSWKTTGQFINDGAFQIGSAAGSGNVQFTIYDKHFNQPAAVTNAGSMVLQNGSRFETNVTLDNNDVFLNTAGAVLSISSGSGSVFDGGPPGDIYSTQFTNNGLIAANGAAGRTTKFHLLTNHGGAGYTGTGLLSVRGAPGDTAANTVADFTYGGMSGTFDIANGTLNHTEVPSSGSSPLAGTVNFLDNNGVLAVRSSTTTGTFNTATINGFTAGDHITYEAYYKATGLSYDPATHKLTLTLPGGTRHRRPCSSPWLGTTRRPTSRSHTDLARQTSAPA